MSEPLPTITALGEEMPEPVKCPNYRYDPITKTALFVCGNRTICLNRPMSGTEQSASGATFGLWFQGQAAVFTEDIDATLRLKGEKYRQSPAYAKAAKKESEQIEAAERWEQFARGEIGKGESDDEDC